MQFTEGKREIFGSWLGDCEDYSHMECDSVVPGINLATFQVYVIFPFPEYWQVTLKLSSGEFRESRFSGFGVDAYIL